MKQLYKYYLYCLIVFLTCCRKDPTPEPGFDKTFYIKLDFQNEQILIQQDEIQCQARVSAGPRYMMSNLFKSESANYNVGIEIIFDKNPVEKSDIVNLEGKIIPIKDTDFPYVIVYLERKNGGNQYCTGIDQIDYGISNFTIDEVIKSKMIDVSNKSRRSYILRGEFNLNVSKAIWVSGVPDTLYPISNGEFSMLLYVP